MGFQREQRSFWHTTVLAKSSVLYLYPKDSSKTAACATSKHRLLLLRCGVKRSLPFLAGSVRLNDAKGTVA